MDGMARSYAEWFELPFENVRIISPYIGGGFGSKALSLPHAALAIMAARKLDRPVKLAVTRAQTFTAFGGRPATRQTLALGATKQGKLLSIVQRGANETAMTGVAVEPLGAVTSIMYDVPNFSSRQNIVPVHTVLPGALRAPGENPSAWGLESAIDELAYAVGIDPVEIRLLNYAERDPHAKIPWSTRQLREAFAVGGEAFGWSKRSPKPRSMRDGNALIGWGVAAGTYRCAARLVRHSCESLPMVRQRLQAAASTWARGPIPSWPRLPLKSLASPSSRSTSSSATRPCRGRPSLAARSLQT
ncbi:hypothetical protein AJ87_48065 [Rhizobium yanglingense]|nr:hypothetical protein AJ87_48065 [Rhizobium yanglingense]